MNAPVSLFGLDADFGQGAVLSPCRTWRYALERRWGSGPFVLFVMLNPSTADESVDDPTIRRCIGFARSWGFGGLLVGNLFALRATDPGELWRAADPVGPDNETWLETMAVRASLAVAAWGAHPFAARRVEEVLEWRHFDDLRALGLTKQGHPRHPLYVRGDAQPLPFTPARTGPPKQEKRP